MSRHIPLPSKDDLLSKYSSVPISQIPTPALLLDRAKIVTNSRQMIQTAEAVWRCKFRAHIKTHKTQEGTLAQVESSRDHAIVVSTLAEAWGVLNSGLIEDGTVLDILYGLPLAVTKVEEFLEIRQAILDKNPKATVKALLDHPEQAKALDSAVRHKQQSPIEAFIKIDCGYRRAGLTTQSSLLVDLVDTILTSSHLTLWGLYCHAGFSYDSKNLFQAKQFLSKEMQSVQEAAKFVRKVATGANSTNIRTPLVLSVGSTPTAHAASQFQSAEEIDKIKQQLGGELELHAGNYSFLDLQQLATTALPSDDVAQIERCAMTILVTVVATYPGRAISGHVSLRELHRECAERADEALCDGGGLAFSKDTGPFLGYGHVVWPAHYIGWQLGRISQEHGILTIRSGSGTDWSKEWGYRDSMVNFEFPNLLKIGDKIQIVPQHACMAAAAHPWFYVFDSSLKEEVPTVKDIWVPWKGW